MVTGRKDTACDNLLQSVVLVNLYLGKRIERGKIEL